MTISEQVVKAMPERIYAAKKTEGSNCVVSFDTPSLDYNVEYVRADLVPFLPVQGAAAARELALEEIIALCRDYGEDSQPDSEYRLACNDIIEAIQERRALSSPDHADAGKVEGDGWQSIKSAPKDGTPVLAYQAGRYFKCWLECDRYEGGYFWQDEEDSEPSPTHWRPLPSAPASEGAE